MIHLKLQSMDWIYHYQLFLFDFDGILVNTEELHYKAYLKMCKDRGFSLGWDMRTYVQHAMFTATGVKEGIYRDLPGLHEIEPDWDVLYQEKKRAYLHLLNEGNVFLMPGVEHLLMCLEKAKIKRCVVTHSPLEQINLIKKQQPVLETIPWWITREDYSAPKPASECYEKAIRRFKTPGDSIIGFEDSPRGLKALTGTEAQAVLVTQYFTPSEVQVGRSFIHQPSFLGMTL